MAEKFYFDTYALVEIYKSNPRYEKYTKEINLLLNKLNLLEFAFFLLREGKENEIKTFFSNLEKHNVDYDGEVLIKAAEMKFKFLKERLSFVDCIGYILAKKNNALFLTGDERFRNKENVEFVK